MEDTMKRDVLIAAVLPALLLLSSATTRAQERCDISRSARTSTVGEARFEVLTLAEAGETYRLDRISGEVWHLQRSGSRFTAMTLAWKTLPMPPGEEGATTPRVNFQLLLSERGNFPMLLNIHTGATWTLRTAAGDVKWEAIAVEK
jgi:hypothetical protein